MFRPILLALTLAVAGCAGQEQWKTDYTQIDPATTAGWSVRSVSVAVPETLTVSEQNVPLPNADIVWHGEAEGDRRAQVAEIMREGITAGAAGLGGKRGVTIAATVTQFHALTPQAAQLIQNFSGAGVDNISYTAQVFDARTGEALTEPQAIQAAMPSTTLDNRAEIVAHIAAVTQNWLGRGADPRVTFNRFGR
ncbi:hypothetical protein DRW48_01300 [Paracoccus suum]|uniref:Lipoprotein n=1 Tax=Paracoccus suum TaxID=2259340 RepID=A0A344PGL4_9RHOB|nr:DUF6778 family protein [Paracoccus suum]AXC48519.1 hypothetical protein DRW48_01300 [Paracoccus suum]